jgi:hypothetical protein
LPHLTINDNHVLIDTGSSINIINPNNSLIRDKRNEHFMIKTANNETIGSECCKIKLPEISDEEIDCKIYKFSEKYDILIGSPTLIKLGANVNYLLGSLITSNGTLPLQGINMKKVTPCESKITLKTNRPPGLYVCPKISELNLVEGLVECKNGYFTIFTQFDKEYCYNSEMEIDLEEIDHHPELVTLDKVETLIRCNHLSESEKRQLCLLVQKYSKTLKTPDNELQATNLLNHKINTIDDNPVYSRNYRYPYAYQEAIRIEVEKLIKDKIIRTSNSPYNSPLWVVPKKPDASGLKKVRLVVDYRKLNDKTIDDKFPLPNIEDILCKLGQATYFSTLDLASGFHQIKVDESDIHKTAFSTENGHFEFVRMPFGLKNGPPTFQRMMNIVFAELPNVLIYLDDIIVFSSSFQEHLGDLKQVFEKLQNHNLQIQLDKCEFIKPELQFLGHLIKPDGIHPNPFKIEAIKQFPLPKTEKEIKQFLGMTGYYRKLIKNYAKIAQPLSNALKKSETINTNNKNYIDAFENLKKALSNDPVLKIPDFSKEFILTTDASNFAIGGVLSQKFDNIEHPVAFSSRTLNNAEINLDTTQKEVLSVIWNVKHFRPYLYGKKFLIRTDHQPLQWLRNLKEPNAKLTRWRLALEEYDYRIEYVPGKSNQVADALSRISLPQNENFVNEEIIETVEIENRNEAEDSDCETVHSQLSSDEANGIAPPNSAINKETNQIILKRGKFNIENKRIFNKNRLIIQVNDKEDLRRTMPIILGHIKTQTRYGIHFKLPFIAFEDDAREIILELIWLAQAKLYGNKFIIYDTLLEDVINEELQNELIIKYHEGKSAHRGILENVSRLKRIYYWPGMVKDVTKYVNNCETCNKVKYERKPLKVPFEKTPTPVRPFQTIQIDTFSFSTQKVLTITCVFSKFLFAYPLQTFNRLSIIKGLRIFLSLYPTPEIVVCDNGTEFSNSTVCQFLTLHNIKVHFISSGHPESLGALERLHGTYREILIALQEDNKKLTIENALILATSIYNNTIGSLCKMTPFEIIFGPGHNLRDIELGKDQLITEQIAEDRLLELKALHKAIRTKLDDEKEKRTEQLNESRKDSNVLGNRTFIKDLRKRKHLPKYIGVSKIQGNLMLTKKNKVIKVHPSRCKRPKLLVPDNVHVDVAPSTSNTN